jgi:hypothetical protein
MRMDSGFWSAKLIARLRAHRVRYSITVRQTKTVRAAIAAITEADWVDIGYTGDGLAQVAETPYRGDRLIVRRVRNLGDQQQLFATWRYHAFVTDRPGTTIWLDADHRRHAVCELAIRDLKAGAGLAHLPSGTFTANAAWLLAATLAHNLLRWTDRLGLGTRGQLTVAKTIRRTLLTLPGRLTRSARRGRCTCRPGGPGPTRSRWHSPGCAASRTPPDRRRHRPAPRQHHRPGTHRHARRPHPATHRDTATTNRDRHAATPTASHPKIAPGRPPHPARSANGGFRFSGAARPPIMAATSKSTCRSQ